MRQGLPPNGRVLFPNGPWRGPGEARGWWWLNIEGHVPKGQRFPDFSGANPGGIKVASGLVREFLEDVPGPIVLGGFSQGAMLSGEIAFQSEQPLAGLVLLGGTTVNEAAWVERFPGRRRLPIFIAHGRNDGVLPLPKFGGPNGSYVVGFADGSVRTFRRGQIDEKNMRYLISVADGNVVNIPDR